MKDRIPTRPNRRKITFEDDNTVKYAKIEYADEPIEEGTPLNKGNLLSDETALKFGLEGDSATVNNAFDKVDIVRVGDTLTSTKPSPPSGKYAMFDGRQKLLPEDYPELYQNQGDIVVQVAGSGGTPRQVFTSSVSDYYWKYVTATRYQLSEVTQGAVGRVFTNIVVDSPVQLPASSGDGAVYLWHGITPPYQLARLQGATLTDVSGVTTDSLGTQITPDGTGAVYTNSSTSLVRVTGTIFEEVQGAIYARNITSDGIGSFYAWNGVNTPYQLVRITGTTSVNVANVVANAVAPILPDGTGAVYTWHQVSSTRYLVRVLEGVSATVSGVSNTYTSLYMPMVLDGVGGMYTLKLSGTSYLFVRVVGVTSYDVVIPGNNTSPNHPMIADGTGSVYAWIDNVSPKRLIRMTGIVSQDVIGTTVGSLLSMGDGTIYAWSGGLKKVVGLTVQDITGFVEVNGTTAVLDGKGSFYTFRGSGTTAPLVKITSETVEQIDGVNSSGTGIITFDITTDSLYVSRTTNLIRYGKLNAINSISSFNQYTYIKAVK